MAGVTAHGRSAPDTAGHTGPPPTAGPPAAAASWRVQDVTRLAIVFAATNVVLYTLLSLAQWAGWGGLHRAVDTSAGEAVSEALAVTAVSFGYGLVLIAGTFALHPMARPWTARVVIICAVALVASVPRAAALLAIQSTPTGDVYVAAEWAAGFAAGVVAVGAGVFAAALIHRARQEEQRRQDAARRAVRAVEELQEEEMRVRRMVSDQLHGTLQHHLVTVTAGLDRVVEELRAAGDTARADEVHEWAETLEQIREQDVRSLSHAVFPAGTDLGTAEAIGIMLRRLPPQIDASIETGPAYRRLTEPDEARFPVAERLVAIYTVEEAVTNALKHGHAHAVRVVAEARPTDDPCLWILDAVVDDDGSGPTQPDPPLHGLERHRDRIRDRGGTLELGTNPAGGGRLAFSLPFRACPPA